jgi:hypothetical protein
MNGLFLKSVGGRPCPIDLGLKVTMVSGKYHQGGESALTAG